ncbi:hypothetical protein XMIN_2605 [Xanthomonas citri pv. mangiferaeindicae LMG 941]|uniref:lasso peptide biosynthesis B2 protein n=1 Tax=Xanthomonas citri TaxID=346 RepID=UPI0002552B02|nr:lasso peptide biosynthesis B2 protein [Xanthomonas citri]CCG37616.1 hypothetical protein XMIN_2605 [Xanthomonas citri pv. mangiferaeindicae LMG 941]
MARHLNEDISYCQLDGHLYFLDLQHDRYFQLSQPLEHDFLRYLESPDHADLDIGNLIRNNLLSQTSATSSALPYPALGPPSQSLIEATSLGCRIAPTMILDVFLSVVAMRWQLKTRPLKIILQMLAQYRHRRTRLVANDEAETRRRIEEAAAAFNHIRPYVPIETRCLIDSLAMIRYLARRRLHAHLVMGVSCDPFSAHAWVQYGPLILNDTVGNALAHVPIRVI